MRTNYWGLDETTVSDLSERLVGVFDRYKHHFRTKTRDTSRLGFTMLKGYLLLETSRTYVNIAKRVEDYRSDGQALQQFMSDSPWETSGIFRQITTDIINLGLVNGTLNFDESGDTCSGSHKIGAARQYIGREGKVEMGQVGVVASFSINSVWFLLSGELYIPESWFKKFTTPSEKEKAFKRYHLPMDRVFKTKIELAIEQYDTSLANNLPFEVVGADSFYGRNSSFRKHIADSGKYYLVSISCDQQVWLEHPYEPGSATSHCTKLVKNLADTLTFEMIEVRDAERGILQYEHAFCYVWTQDPVNKLEFRKEILVIRKENDGSYSYALSNGLDKDHLTLARWRAERYFVERTIQDIKSELGFDELQALKYRAYMHTLALCAVALMFMAETKLEQRKQYAAEEDVKKNLEISQLPDLSLANVKELLKAAIILPQLSPKQAVEMVIDKLFRRAKAKQHKFKKQLKNKTEQLII